MTTLQGKIEEHVEDKQDPCLNITLTGESGSFDLKEAVRLTLIDGQDVTCNSAEGKNELSLINCQNVKIKDFKEGVIRIEKCDEIDEITCSEKTSLTVSGAKIQKVDLTGAVVTFVDCQIEDAKFDRCEITSIECEYQKFDMQICQIHSDNDKFKDDFNMQDNCVGTFIKPEFSKDCTFDSCVLDLTKAKSEKAVTLTDCRFIDNRGEYSKEFTVSGQKTTCSLVKTQFKDQVDFSDAMITGSGVESEKEMTFTSVSFNLKGLIAQKEVTISQARGVLSSCEFKDSLTTDSCALTLRKAKVEKDFQLQGGAVESENSEFKGDVTITGGTVESIKDKFTGQVQATDLVAFNKFFKPDTQDTFDLSGSTTTSLEITDSTDLELTCDGFGRVSILGGSLKEPEFTSIKMLNLIGTTPDKPSFSDCSTVICSGCEDMGDVACDNLGTGIFDGCIGGKLTSNNCGQILAATSTFEFKFDNTCLGVTANADKVECTSSNLIDQGSSGVSATDSQLIVSGSTVEECNSSVCNANGGDVTCDGSVLNISNGTFTATGASTVLASNSDGTNDDGLTSGTGFSADDQASALLADGLDTLLQNSLGNLTMKSLVGDVTVEAALNSFTIAGASINEVAFGDITNTCDGAMIHTTLGEMTLTADVWSNNIATVASINAGDIVEVIGGQAVTVNGSQISLLGEMIYLN